MTVVYFDGSCEPRNPGGHGTYGIIAKRGGETIHTDHGYIGHGVTNNVAEYAGLIRALEYVRDECGISDAQVTVRGDSQLVIRQMTGEYRVNSERLRPLWCEARSIVCDLSAVTFEWVPREENDEADALASEEYRRVREGESEKVNEPDEWGNRTTDRQAQLSSFTDGGCP